MPFSDREVFSITPVVAGAGRGGPQILLGAVLIAVAIAAPVAGLTASGFAATGAAGFRRSGWDGSSGHFAAAAGNLGIALVLGGIAQSISPQPEPPSLDDSVQLESFTFSNVVNTSRQGMPCPIAYGRVFVGSAVLSSGLDVDQVQV